MRPGRIVSLLIVAAWIRVLAPAVASAETLHIKGGGRIEAEILERGERFVRVRTEKAVIRLPISRFAPRAPEAISEARAALERGEFEAARRAIEIELFWSPADAEAAALLARLDAAEVAAREDRSLEQARSFLADAREKLALAKAGASGALTVASSEAALATLRDLEFRVRSRAAAIPEGPAKEELEALTAELRQVLANAARLVFRRKEAAERALANARREQMVKAQRYASRLQRSRRGSSASGGRIVLNPTAGRSGGTRALGGGRIHVGIEAAVSNRGPRGAISGGGIGGGGGMRVRARSR